MRRLLPLLLATLVALIGVTPAHAEESLPTTGWLQIQDPIRLDDQVHAEHVFMSQGARTTYQWYADGMELAGATRQQLPVGEDLLGARILVKSVITFDGQAPITLTSNESGPVISRALWLSVQAQTLDCTTGQIIRPQVDVEKDGAKLSYQWFLDGQALPGETSHELTLVESMALKTASLRVTASLAPYLDATQTSSTHCPILPSKVTPGTVKLVGAPTVGSALTTQMSGWQPANHVQYKHEWFVDGVLIQDADFLQLLPQYVGKEVRVQVTGTGGVMQTATVESGPMKVLPGVYPSAPPAKVTGIAMVGWVMTAESPEWTPKTNLSWQWHRVTPAGADVVIPGATKSWYRLTGADEGAKVYAVATGSAMGYVKASVSSAVSRPVAYNLYTTPGARSVNGRQWRTACEPYSKTSRCRTEIWATQVQYENGQFISKTGWVFNNLTYLPSPRSLWSSNSLGYPDDWWSEGRHWKTECDNKTTGRNACRSYIWTDFIASSKGTDGVWVHRRDAGWVFNNQVFFS